MKEINKTIEGYNVNGICVGCLNYNRKMFQLDEANACFKILGNIDVSNDVTIKVCWECLATIRNTMRFKKQLEKSFNKISKYSRMYTSLRTPEDLTQFATQRLGISKTKIDSYPCLEDESIISIKIEPEEYVNDEYNNSNSQQNMNPDRVSCSVVKPSNLQTTHMHTSVGEPENASHNSTQRLNIVKTKTPLHPNQVDENKFINIYVKQEPQEIPIDFDESGLDGKDEDHGWEDINQDDDLSSDSMSSEDDMPLSKPQSGPNACKIKLEGKTKNTEKGKTEIKPCKTTHAFTASDHLQSKCDCSQRYEKPTRKTNAERQRAFRLRQKQRKLEQRRAKLQNYTSETGELATDISCLTCPKPKPPKKTNAERQRDFRIRQKQAQNENGEKPPKKSRAEYLRQYRLQRKLAVKMNSEFAEINSSTCNADNS